MPSFHNEDATPIASATDVTVDTTASLHPVDGGSVSYVGSISIGTVTSGDAPAVTNVGTPQDAVLNFILEKGNTGDPGKPLADGDYGDISVSGAVYTVNPDAPNILNKVQHCSDRVELSQASQSIPAFLNESGREGIFIFKSSDMSASVAGDAREGLFVAPQGGTGTTGAWERLVDGYINAGWFGLVDDGVTDNRDAVVAALAVANTLSVHKIVRIPHGSYALAQSISIPDGLTLEGYGTDSVLIAKNVSGTDPWVVRVDNGSGFVIRNIKMTPVNTVAWRSAIYLNLCQNAKILDLTVDEVTNSTAVYLWDCDYCTVERLYFNGGNPNGFGTYFTGCVGCRVSNSVAINCFGGFVLSGSGTDTSTRTIADTHGNTIEGCYVRTCASQAFNINSSTYNTVSNCHAEDYVGLPDPPAPQIPGTGIHKAFQVKDAVGFENSSIGNVFIGCTVKNYAAGFGGVRTAQASFIGCSARDLSTNGLEMTECQDFVFNDCVINEVAQAGIWAGSSCQGHVFNGVRVETTTPTAKILLVDPAGELTESDIDGLVTDSAVAAYCDLTVGSVNNRFGWGCRSNGNQIIDASNDTMWPLRVRSGIFSLTVGGTHPGTDFLPRGMHVALARWVTTTTITGTPAVDAGEITDQNQIVAAQPVTGSAGTSIILPQVSQVTPGNYAMAAKVNVVGTAGAGYVQFEGLPLS